MSVFIQSLKKNIEMYESEDEDFQVPEYPQEFLGKETNRHVASLSTLDQTTVPASEYIQTESHKPRRPQIFSLRSLRFVIEGHQNVFFPLSEQT